MLDGEERAALAALEAQELVVRRVDGRREVLDMGHPLFGDVVRARMPGSRHAALLARLADAVAAHGARRATDAQRVAGWRLEAGGAADPALLTRAARDAFAAMDGPSRRAAGGGGGAGGRRRRRAARARPRARRNRAGGGGRGGPGGRAGARGHDGAGAQPVLGPRAPRRGRRAARRGRRPGAHRAAGAARGRGGPEPGRAHRRAAAPGGRARRPRRRGCTRRWPRARRSSRADGRSRRARSWPTGCRPRCAGRRRCRGPSRCCAACRATRCARAGRPAEAIAVHEGVYEASLRLGSGEGCAVEAGMLGYAWLARGRVETARRCFRESATLLRDGDAVGMRPWALAGLAQAAAQAGDAEAARAALAEMEAAPLAHLGFGLEVTLARAWAAAAGGELSRARALALEGADEARARGHDGFEVRARHEALRLGAAGEALTVPGATVEGPFAGLAAAHAAVGDGAALLDVAERFADAGLLLVAAEAAGAAGRRLPRRGAGGQRATRRGARDGVAAGLRGRAAAGAARARAGRGAHAARAGGRPARRERVEQRRDRRAARRLRPHGRQPPPARLRQAGDRRPARAGRRARLSSRCSCTPARGRRP